MTPTNNKLKVQDVEINIRVINEADYISLIPPEFGGIKNEAGVNCFYSVEKCFKILVETIKEQRAVLDKVDYLKSIKKLSNDTYISMESNKKLDK